MTSSIVVVFNLNMKYIFFFFKQKTAYEIMPSLVGSEMCIRDRHDTVTKITNIKAYMVTALYNAPSTMNHYYQQEVQHDMYGGGWEEKGIV